MGVAILGLLDSPSDGVYTLNGSRAKEVMEQIKSGEITFRDGEYLGVHPGKLIRGPQTAPMKVAAE